MESFGFDKPVSVSNPVICIYGEAGVGKTSFANTAESVYLLDCDKGVHRAICHQYGGRPSNWNDITNLINGNTLDDLGIKTLVVDTGDTLLDDFLSKPSDNDQSKMQELLWWTVSPRLWSYERTVQDFCIQVSIKGFGLDIHLPFN